MGGKYAEFDRDALDIRPPAERVSDMRLEDVLAVGERPMSFDRPDLPRLHARLAERMGG